MVLLLKSLVLLRKHGLPEQIQVYQIAKPGFSNKWAFGLPYVARYSHRFSLFTFVQVLCPACKYVAKYFILMGKCSSFIIYLLCMHQIVVR